MSRRRGAVRNTRPEIELIDDDFYEAKSRFIVDAKSRGLSKDTIRYYEQHLTEFMNTLEGLGFKTHLRRITATLIKSEYITYRLEEDGVTHNSVATSLRALRSFFNWAKRERIIEESPMDEVIIGSPKPRRIDTFSREQIFDILSQPDRSLFVGLRDLAIMLVLLDSGMRVRELRDLRVDDARLGDSQIMVLGKNGEYRPVPINIQTKRVLKQYIDERGKSPVDWLFISVDDKQLSRHAVRKRIAKYGELAGIQNIRCSPHTFRHTFSKMYIQNGGDIFTLQKILGHSTMDMVRTYVNMFSNDVMEAHDRFSPVENLRLKL